MTNSRHAVLAQRKAAMWKRGLVACERSRRSALFREHRNGTKMFREQLSADEGRVYESLTTELSVFSPPVNNRAKEQPSNQ